MVVLTCYFKFGRLENPPVFWGATLYLNIYYRVIFNCCGPRRGMPGTKVVDLLNSNFGCLGGVSFRSVYYTKPPITQGCGQYLLKFNLKWRGCLLWNMLGVESYGIRQVVSALTGPK